MGSEPALERSEGVTRGVCSICEGLFFKIEPCLRIDEEGEEDTNCSETVSPESVESSQTR